MFDIKILYSKRTKIQGMNKILERLLPMIQSSDFSLGFCNRLSGVINISRELEFIYDNLFFAIRDCEYNGRDLPSNLSRDIDKILKSCKLDLVRYFEFKYELDLILYSKSTSSALYKVGEYTSAYLAILYMLNSLIEISKLRADKRVIEGVDVKTGNLKYKSAELLFDSAMLVFRTQQEIEFITRVYPSVHENMLNLVGHGSLESTLDTCDKIDDILRVHKDASVLIDILNQSRGTKFFKPSLKMVEKTLVKFTTVFSNHEIISQRSSITTDKGVLLVSKGNPYNMIESMYIVDKIINSRPYIVVSYKTIDGNRFSDEVLEDTIILPVKFSSAIPSVHPDLIMILSGFYGTEYKDNVADDLVSIYKETYDIISHKYWNYRDRDYISDEDNVKNGKVYRKYKEVEIGVHTAKLGNASDSARALAEELGIKLKPGETIVREHVRKYGDKGTLEIE